VPHPWPDLNKVYPQQADSTLHTNTRFSRRGERKKIHIIDSRNMMGLMSFPGVVFLSFCYVLLHPLLPLWPLRLAELFPTLDSQT